MMGSQYTRCQRDREDVIEEEGEEGVEETEDRIGGNGRSQSLKLRVTVAGPHNSNRRRQGWQGDREG